MGRVVFKWKGEERRKEGVHTMMYFEGAGFPFPTKITSLLGYLLSTILSGEALPELALGIKELTSIDPITTTYIYGVI
jgi:hypothetical protein